MDFPDQVVADLPYGNFVILRGAEHKNVLLRPRNGEENQRGDLRVKNLHAELYRCLSLGIWKEDKWDCSDTEIQESVINTINDFLDYFTKRTLNHFLIKNSVVEIVKVLESIIDCQNESLLMNTLEVVKKMVTILPSSAPHFNQALDLLRPLTKLLASQQIEVVILTALTSNIILSKLLLPGQEKRVLEVLQKSKATVYLVMNVERYPDEISIEYFQKNILVLGNILWRWPCFRFSVWNNANFLLILGDMMSLDSNNDLKVSILQLYSSIVLCKHGAEKILGEALLENMVRYMDNSVSHIVCINAFKLAQCLAITKRGCAEMMRICDKRLTNAITNAIDYWSFEKQDKNRISVLKEACRLASIMRCTDFWGEGMCKLIEMVLDEDHKTKVLQQREVSMDELISIVSKDFSSDMLPSVRPYVWDIIGGLATDCTEFKGDEFLLKVLIICASLCFTKSVAVPRLNSYTPLMCEGEAASTTIFRLMYSPCQYVATETRMLLLLVTESSSLHVDFLLRTLVDCRLAEAQVANLHVLTSLVSLTCYNNFHECRQLFVDFNGVEILLGFISWWIDNPIRTKRGRMVPRLYDERSCCSSLEEWEGEDVLLVYSLWILAEFLRLWANEEIDPLDNQVDFIETELIQKLKDIFRGRFSQGSRWCASYVLSSERIEQYRHRNKHSYDMKILARISELEAQGMPKWGTPVPIFDPIAALRSAGQHIVNIVRLESNTGELIDWKCDNCSSYVPHLHVPKVLLESSCDYMRALFQSDMKDSQPYTIMVPLEWESLKKFGRWLYTDELPKPELDCLWENNLDLKNKETVVRVYMEIYNFANYCCTKELLEQCHDIICCFLKSSRELSVTIIKLAADYSLNKLVQVIAEDMAPLYHHLRNSEDLNGYDNVVEIIRLASVRAHLLQTRPKTG